MGRKVIGRSLGVAIALGTAFLTVPGARADLVKFSLVGCDAGRTWLDEHGAVSPAPRIGLHMLYARVRSTFRQAGYCSMSGSDANEIGGEDPSAESAAGCSALDMPLSECLATIAPQSWSDVEGLSPRNIDAMKPAFALLRLAEECAASDEAPIHELARLAQTGTSTRHPEWGVHKKSRDASDAPDTALWSAPADDDAAIPVPEPASLGMLVLVGVGLLVPRQRRSPVQN